MICNTLVISLKIYFLTCYSSNNNNDEIKQEILKSLKPHDELIVFDSSNTLKLKQRHKGIKLQDQSNVKGYFLSERTMQIAVPAINIAIYINPTLTFLAEIAFITATIEENGTQSGITIFISYNNNMIIYKIFI